MDGRTNSGREMIVFYSVVLNHHQAPMADALWKLTNGEYRFVELSGSSAFQKGGSRDYSTRPYLIKAWKDETSYDEAKNLARTADVCVFGGVDAMAFQTERLKYGLLSFEMGERWLKKGLKNLLSPRLLKYLCNYYLKGWSEKPLYKLCSGAYTVNDQYRLGTFKGKCYKWGYFTEVMEEPSNIEERPVSKRCAQMRLCSRFIDWKHPDIPVLLAHKLKLAGYFSFVIDMYGTGEVWETTKDLIKRLDVEDVVCLHGAVPNDEVLREMRRHDIFLFTSDHNEGWGAVANEAMSNGAVLIASDAIGSAPYLVEDGKNGLLFSSNNVDSLFEKVSFLLNNTDKIKVLSQGAIDTMRNKWSPKVAAERLLNLALALQKGGETPYFEGPCSKAIVIRNA